MRILVFTGKGGVGKTSVAAATAISCAQNGHKTLIISTDPAHSLADSLESPIGSDPTPCTYSSKGDGPACPSLLWGQQPNSQRRLEETWRDIRQYAVELLSWAGMSEIEAEELSTIPGLDEIFSLADIKEHYDSGEYDVIVVDCAPTAETLRLLSLPEIMSWYIERIFPVERRIVGAVRPILKHLKSLPPIATDRVFESVERFYEKLDGIKDILTDHRVTTVRLVVNPEKMVIAEAKRIFTHLCLFGYLVDAVVVNRLIPDQVDHPYFDRWKELQKDHLVSIGESFSTTPILKARLFDREVVGPDSLTCLADEIYSDDDPALVFHSEDTMKVAGKGRDRVLSIRVPFVARDEIDLVRGPEELFVRIDGIKRSITLPDALRGMEVTSASLNQDWLNVTFTRPAPAGG